MEQKPRRLASYAYLADCYSLSRVTVWRLVRAGKFPPPLELPGSGESKIIRFDVDAVEAWIAQYDHKRDAVRGASV